MKSSARVTLLIVAGLLVALAGSLFLPRPAARVVLDDAHAQLPSVTPPDLLKSPSPEPTKTKLPDPDDDGGGGGGGGSGGGGGGSGGGGGGSGGGGGGSDPIEDVTGDAKDGAARVKDRGSRDRGRQRKQGGGGTPEPFRFEGTYRPSGSFDTDKLVSVATRLKAVGWSQQKIQQRIYAPFIIAGPAAWTDTWGAPRYGPGPIIRTHEGQDVFCEYGDPVLASETGTVEYDNGGLGGKVARLHRSDGSYWYYAHLSGFNDKEFPNGTTVRAGDVIGFCGNSGNAITTPPHVHFGWYQASGGARNPMKSLVKWLKTAEASARAGLHGATGERIKDIVPLTAERRFGDAFIPDLSTVHVRGESLAGSGSSPAGSTFSVAESALQAALSDNAVDGDGDLFFDLSAAAGAGTVPAHPTENVFDPETQLMHLLNAADPASSETGD